MAKITFYGAARTVTGSKYLVEAAGESVLIDCGMFQGEKRLRELNWKAPPFDVSSLGSVILTHTHIDHIGYLPRLVDHGFRGRVFATPATRELSKILLEDSAKIHEEDTRYHKKHKLSRHKNPLPFFDRQAALKAWSQIVATPRDQWHKVSPVFSFRYRSSGHLLGAASVELVIKENNQETRIVFSGDIGRWGLPFVRDPESPAECDYLVMESTYGSREHIEHDVYGKLEKVVNETVERGGVILIPAFAVGRSQQLVYMLRKLREDGKIPDIPTYLDSPMATNVTETYCKYEHDHGIPLAELEGSSCVLHGPRTFYCRSRDESKALNRMKEPMILVASSGMLSGGRVLHHILHLASDERNTILLAGYQASGTRGRALLEGAKRIRIFRKNVTVRCQVLSLEGLSGHGDCSDLLKWSSSIKTAPKKTFLTHGEYDSALALSAVLQKQRDWQVEIPDLNDSYEL